ncbi:class I SAM-dependent methyltransferase [Paenibacillus sp. UNC496MF]|uniref:class I SAM-dependent methyltransferase n=1 Tax=Paenibacillus sp. UNC496MF TaxID=1502753 RepID=UPI000B87C487|nr:class I SAM-dependent methyltransferase [Paenibacillus sp. UNC496MF]
MTNKDDRSFYERTGARNGWNFSAVRAVAEGEAWQYAEEVRARCGPEDALLDIGTGGGEALLALADDARELVGIDRAAGMIETAKRNAELSGRRNVRFLRMDAERLAFPDGGFDVVCCRHAPFHAGEVARVLKPGGVFVTQQVGEGNKRNLVAAFGRGWQEAPPGTLLRRCVRELRAAGFADVRSFRYDAAEYYRSAEDLMFLLKHAPIIPDFGERDEDFEVLARFAEEHRTGKGIRTNAERMLIVART